MLRTAFVVDVRLQSVLRELIQYRTKRTLRPRRATGSIAHSRAIEEIRAVRARLRAIYPAVGLVETDLGRAVHLRRAIETGFERLETHLRQSIVRHPPLSTILRLMPDLRTSRLDVADADTFDIVQSRLRRYPAATIEALTPRLSQIVFAALDRADTPFDAIALMAAGVGFDVSMHATELLDLIGPVGRSTDPVLHIQTFALARTAQAQAERVLRGESSQPADAITRALPCKIANALASRGLLRKSARLGPTKLTAATNRLGLPLVTAVLLNHSVKEAEAKFNTIGRRS